MLESRVPAARLRVPRAAPAEAGGAWVLYLMTAARRTRWSFALERAAEWARALERPLVVLEGLRAGYRWASARHHRFVLDGMRDQAAAFAARGVTYLPWVEPAPGAGRGLVQALAARACVVVGDDWPGFFLPRAADAAVRDAPGRVELVDSAGIVPFREAGRTFTTALSFRAYYQKRLAADLRRLPLEDPLADLPRRRAPRALDEIVARWPMASPGLLERSEGLDALPIDHAVPVSPIAGGERAGRARLEAFLAAGLGRYAAERSEPASGASSGLSPYLHHGHVSAHEVLTRVAGDPARLALEPSGGRRDGFWGASPDVEAFLEELVTWRELALHTAAHDPDHERYASTPGWARATLADHASDPRPARLGLEALTAAATGDRVWNAAQRQLVGEGLIHNYLRMLWGKRVLEWTRDPEEAWEVLVELNNRWALDGRDPSSYAGIAWIFGRYDRPWAPTRAIFGTVRFMSSAAAEKKLDLAPYLARWGDQPALFPSARAARKR